jgi:NAD(P)H-dependent flavin oxidoreductase YrpB (nitropropane dioxygenase family)
MDIKIIQGGMGVGVSLGNLAGSVAKAGGMGVISSVNAGLYEVDFLANPEEANQRAFINEIRKAKKISEGKGAIAVNIMVATNACDKMYELAVKEEVDAIISGAGLPKNLPEYTKGTKTLAAPIVSSGKAAKLLCKLWDKNYQVIPDFFVIEGSGAGGHLGFKREEIENKTAKSLEIILKEVLEAIKPFEEEYKRKIPVYVAGGIFNGYEIAHFVKLGASGVQMGTRFIATEECDASEGYKQVILDAKDSDVVIVKSPVGMPGRAIKSPLIEKLEDGITIPPTNCNNCIKSCPKGNKTPYCISQALIDAVNGKVESGLFFCGKHVGKVNKIVSVEELMGQLMSEYRKEMES